MDKVLAEIAAERRRQIEQEGWTPEHDDGHEDGELANAAACYAVRSRWLIAPQLFRGNVHPEYPARGHRRLWPFSLGWWKPKSVRTDLIRAAALLVAEVERLDRAEAKGPTHVR